MFFVELTLRIILFLYIKKSSGEQHNLHGDAGQAYALQIHIGSPPQKLNVLVDTGSSTLAIASYSRRDRDIYFHLENSTTVFNSGKEVQAKYSQGTWVGKLVSDLVEFPSLPSIPPVRCDVALITKSHKFFMNGSGWQGLLGLAYLPVGAWGENVVVGSWLDFVERKLNKPMSFQLKLCGAESSKNATHYGNLKMLDDNEKHEDGLLFRTPILRKRWYEIGVLSVRLLNSTIPEPSKSGGDGDNNVMTITQGTATNKNVPEINRDMCIMLNKEKSIVDSGTTSLRLPDVLFRQIVDQLRNAAQTSNMLILDEFWYHGEAACWPEPQEWSLPWLAIDLLSAEFDNQYFTLEIPPQNFMRVVSARYNSRKSGTISEFCYKLGLEGGGTETVLGYTAMEGLQILFNRSASWIAWEASDCGPKARVSGPYNTSSSILSMCQLTQPVPDVALSIKTAQWTLCVISIIAGAVLVYLLAPCIKIFFIKPLPRSQQISLSQAALVETETM